MDRDADRITPASPADKARALDALLVAAARQGDRAALSRLVIHRGPRLLAHARRLADDAEAARDILQDAWAEILRSLPRLADEAAFLPWALRIVTRRAARAVRGRIRQRRLAAGLTAAQVTAPAAVDPVPASDGAALARAVARLPPDQQAVIALFYAEEMPVAEVALALDIPPGTVKTRLHHARARLRGYLEEPDHGPT